MASHQPQEHYTLGYGATATQYYASRTATSEAAFFLPHLRAGMSLLDCGCGPGTVTLGLAEVVTPGEVVGIDSGPSYVERARAVAAERGLSNIRFEVGNIYELPFPDHAFEATFAHAVLNHLGDPSRALGEMYRVLKPGGLIGLRTTYPAGDVHTPADPLADKGMALLNRLYRHNGGDWDVGRRMRGLLLEAGFRPVRGSATYQSYGTLEETRVWAARVAGAFTEPPVSEQLLQLDWATPSELEEIAAYWRAWGEQPDAFYARAWCEAVGWKV